MRQQLPKETIEECKQRLLQLKQDLVNKVSQSRRQLHLIDKSTGDEIDQSNALMEEHQFLTNNLRCRSQILEIELALARIENGSFGICEETDEPIEMERLLLMPWTRLSIEGAEIREVIENRYAFKH